MPGPEAVPVLPALRAMADPAVLDAALAGPLGARLADLDARVLRLAPDDLLVLTAWAGFRGGPHDRTGRPPREPFAPDAAAPDGPAHPAARTGSPGPVLMAVYEEIVGTHDAHAIVEPEAGFAGAWFAADRVRCWVGGWADWLLPAGDGLSQGQVAGLPVKVLVEGERALVVAPTPMAHELAERLEWLA